MVKLVMGSCLNHSFTQQLSSCLSVPPFYSSVYRDHSTTYYLVMLGVLFKAKHFKQHMKLVNVQAFMYGRAFQLSSRHYSWRYLEDHAEDWTRPGQRKCPTCCPIALAHKTEILYHQSHKYTSLCLIPSSYHPLFWEFEIFHTSYQRNHAIFIFVTRLLFIFVTWLLF